MDKKQSVRPELQVRCYSWGEILRRMWPLICANGWRIAVAILTVTLVGLVVAIQPIFVKPIFDLAIPNKDLRLAVWVVGLFVLTMALRMTLWYFGQAQVLWLKDYFLFGMRTQGFAHVQRLCLSFHDRISPGQLYERIFGTSILNVSTLIVVFFQQIAVYLVGLVLSLGICLWLSPPMTGAVLLGAIGYVFTSRRITPRIYRKARELSEKHGEITEFVIDKIRGTKTIQAFAMEEQVKEDFDARVWDLTLQYNTAYREHMRLGFFTEGIGYLLTAVVLVGGTYAVLGGEMKIGTLIAFMGYQGQLISMMTALTNAMGQFAAAKSGFDQYFTVIDTDSRVRDKPGAAMPKTIRGDLEFRNITFAYDQDPVLRDFNLVVRAGETVALVGRSGSGKTTLANLLMRFYDPSGGAILLDGKDIREFPLRPYRQLFGIVLQEPYLFGDTVAYNLRCARPKVSDADIWAALRGASADEFVRRFSDGIHHHVGEGGRLLSGGQRQRLAIARCLLLRPRFVVLDEPTAALDNESEAAIQAAFHELFAGRTVFIIAHRLSTIRHADRILVLDGGRIVEDGNFDSLLAQDGLFHRLYSLSANPTIMEIREDA